MLRSLTVALTLALPALAMLPAPAIAQDAQAQLAVPGRLAAEAPEQAEMLQAIGLYPILEVMAAEGLAGAEALEADMFPGQGGPAWAALAARIHAADAMIDRFEAGWPTDMMTPADIAAVTAFFETDLGQRIVAGELAARRAFLRSELEQAAKDRFADLVGTDEPRIEALTGFIAANDLVERNVTGALNSNFAFYRGLADGGAFEVELPEDLILAEVWGQEPQIRADTTEWLYAYQLTAYDTLSVADIEAYTAFSETEAGARLNAALFAAFDAMFDRMSYDLGQAAAVFIAGEDT